MKRKLLLLWTFLLCFAAGSFAEEVTIDFTSTDALSKYGIEAPTTSGSATNLDTNTTYEVTEDITFSVTSGGTSTRIWNSSGKLDFRMYKNGGSITLNCKVGNITSVVVNGDAVVFSELTNKQWTGSSPSVTLTATNTCKVSQITVTYENNNVSVKAPTIDGVTPFVGSTTVTLACETTGATLYYTIDGKEPTAESTPYTGPFTLTESATVKAVAILNGEASTVATTTVPLKWTNRSLKLLKYSLLGVISRVNGLEFVTLQSKSTAAYVPIQIRFLTIGIFSRQESLQLSCSQV